MPWPNVPQLIYTDRVCPQQVTEWDRDKAGGRVPVYGPIGQPMNCSVSAASADDVTVHSRESMIVTHVVTSNERLGYMRDRLIWQETGAILTIVSVQPAGDGTGRIWEHYTEERPLR